MNRSLANDIQNSIREIPDFPKPGVNFIDLTTVMKNGPLFREITQTLVNRYNNQEIDAVVGIESRGFIFGASLASELGVGFIPVRKPGKLPHKVESIEISTEYSCDIIEIHKDALSPGHRVVVIDDILATGGTASACLKLLEKLGAEVIECGFIVEICKLSGRQLLGDNNIFTLFESNS